MRGLAVPVSRRRPPAGEKTLEQLSVRFGIGAVEAAGISRLPAAMQAIGLTLNYLFETRSADLPMRFPRLFSREDVMELDASTIRNLEILTGISQDPRAGLWSVIDRAKTAMGSRLLRRWLIAPLRRPAASPPWL